MKNWDFGPEEEESEHSLKFGADVQSIILKPNMVSVTECQRKESLDFLAKISKISVESQPTGKELWDEIFHPQKEGRAQERVIQ